MAQIKLILLDFDGTLADTRLANAHAYIEALAEVGIELSVEEYLARFFGMRCIEFMRSVGIKDDNSIQALRQRKIELYPNYFSSVRLNEPLWEWCKMMRAMGAKVWIVSTGHINNIRNVMRYLNIESGIDGILSGDDVTVAKPAPDCFLKAMEIEGCTPEETIIFEDSSMGLEAARRSGAAYVKIVME
ncbi:MAG: HAD-IA family hydrolase [Alistipes sp.]|jgi:beta-phosphoglucomutase-like phosphatase (HAD superfamily)|nr:HAD-IA family hydrolase [Alistipes sp.]